MIYRPSSAHVLCYRRNRHRNPEASGITRDFREIVCFLPVNNTQESNFEKPN